MVRRGGPALRSAVAGKPSELASGDLPIWLIEITVVRADFRLGARERGSEGIWPGCHGSSWRRRVVGALELSV